MILIRSPFRISLLGGGTDYSNYIQANGSGLCLGFAINKYSYIWLRSLPPFFQYKTKLVYSDIELVNNIVDIEHSAIRNTLKYFMVDNPELEIHHMSDCPSYSGLGSSSAFIVSLVKALYQYKNLLTQPSTIVEVATHIEQNLMKKSVGWQDAVFASLGGFLKIEFSHFNNHITFSSAALSENVGRILEEYGLLVYITGMPRDSSDVVGKYIKTLDKNYYQKQIHGLAIEGLELINSGNFKVEEFAKLLDLNWKYKKHISWNISNDRIDQTYKELLNKGILGGKILGGGGGGSFFLLAEPDSHVGIIRYCRENGLVVIPFKIEKKGSKQLL